MCSFMRIAYSMTKLWPIMSKIFFILSKLQWILTVMVPSRRRQIYSYWLLHICILHLPAQGTNILSLDDLYPEILHSPTDTTAFLNQSAAFTCETDEGTADWKVNASILTSLPPEIHSDMKVTVNYTTKGTTVEVLTIPARAKYNGTRVQCVVLTLEGPSVESDNATLNIQGPLSAVGNLSSTNLAPSITIFWTAPYSLNVTGVDPDIWYSVLIYNVTDEDNPTAVHCTDCTNITETHYTFTPDYPSPCHVYNFSVTPFNGAGQGESRDVKVEVLKLARECIKARNDSQCDVTFRVDGQLETVYNISLNGSNFTNSSCIADSKVTFKLPENKEYFASFKVEYACGEVDVSSANFTTFDVQNPQATPLGDGKVNVTGMFINESQATGCFLAIQSNSSTEDTFFALKRNGTEQFVSEVITLPPSKYSIYVYDLEEDALPSRHAVSLNPADVTVNGTYRKPKSDEKVKNATISFNGTFVTVECVPEQNDTSCVLIYRAHQNSTLNVVYDKTFPMNINITESKGNITFALFRRTQGIFVDIDEQPFTSTVIWVKTVSKEAIPTYIPVPNGPYANRNGVLPPIAPVICWTIAGTAFVLIDSLLGLMLAIKLKRQEEEEEKEEKVVPLDWSWITESITNPDPFVWVETWS